MTRRSYAGGKKGLRSRPCPWLSMVAPAYDQLTSWSIEAVAHGQLLDWAPLQLGEIGEELSSVRDWHLCLRRRPAARWRRGSRDDAAAIETRQALPHAGKASFSRCARFHLVPFVVCFTPLVSTPRREVFAFCSPPKARRRADWASGSRLNGRYTIGRRGQQTRESALRSAEV